MKTLLLSICVNPYCFYTSSIHSVIKQGHQSGFCDSDCLKIDYNSWFLISFWRSKLKAELAAIACNYINRSDTSSYSHYSLFGLLYLSLQSKERKKDLMHSVLHWGLLLPFIYIEERAFLFRQPMTWSWAANPTAWHRLFLDVLKEERKKEKPDWNFIK